tara:strand:- start:18787 stop:19101 length:315 start_codon:yes stop_codon:yes gene_type:complete
MEIPIGADIMYTDGIDLPNRLAKMVKLLPRMSDDETFNKIFKNHLITMLNTKTLSKLIKYEDNNIVEIETVWGETLKVGVRSIEMTEEYKNMLNREININKILK